METDFKQFPQGWHTEYPEPKYEPYLHPGYENVMCKYCKRVYIEAIGVPHRYDCGDSQVHK
jgi:hypothetical protein